MKTGYGERINERGPFDPCFCSRMDYSYCVSSRKIGDHMHDEDRHVFDELALEAQISRGRAIKLAGAAVVAAAFGAFFPDTAEARRRGRRKKGRNRFGLRRGFRNGFLLPKGRTLLEFGKK